MDDCRITALFMTRDEDAIAYMSAKYGAQLQHLAENILGSRADAEECVSDTYLAMWNTIPPQNPRSLFAYASRILRNSAVDKRRQGLAKKRHGRYERSLDELASCIADDRRVEDDVMEGELSRAINEFLGRIDTETRVMFVRRYFFSDSVSDIAQRLDTTTTAVSVKLHRVRERLRQFLIEEGFNI